MTRDDAHEDRKSIGSYRILEQIGEGGMAEVFLAEQSEPIQRRVALKILKAGMDSNQVLARFESERQALAVLEHAHIATVFDGGIADNGRPYVVMEYVDGVPITDYCDSERLSTRDRIRLFVNVCRAVQHAHLKGLVHRDLKPSNILVATVDGKPQPKVIDFGVAKAIEAPLTDSTLETRIGQVVGTPQYMSPEQTGLGEIDIDSRADVYSLGVVLYELLAGTPPLDLSAVRDIALASVIREKMPPTPSTRFTSLGDNRISVARAHNTSEQDLSRALKGDLDWIAMKAIEKDRERRYETANALAMDCERFLNHEPVLARPPSYRYRLSRFIRRNRALTTAASAAIIALGASAVISTIAYLRAAEAEQLARQEAETTAQVTEFLVGLFQTSDPAEAQGSNISAREVLDRGVGSIATDLEDQPIVQAELQVTMGGVYRTLQLLEEAERLFSSAFETRTRLLGSDHPETLVSANWLAIVNMESSRFEEARLLHTETLARRRRILGDLHPDTLKSLHNLATVNRVTSRFEEAETQYLEALAGEKEALGDEDDLTLLTLNNIGALYQQTGRYDEAKSVLQLLADTYIRKHGNDHPQTLFAVNSLADFLLTTGQIDSAETLFADVLQRSRRVLGPNHARTLWTQDGLANVYVKQNRIDDAETLLRKSIAGLRQNLGDEHVTTLGSISSLAELYKAIGRYEEAIPIYTEVLDVRARKYPNDIDTGIAYHNLAAALSLVGRFEEALSLFSEAARIWEPMVPADHVYLMENTRLWADAKLATGDSEGAAVMRARLEELRGPR